MRIADLEGACSNRLRRESGIVANEAGRKPLSVIDAEPRLGLDQDNLLRLHS